MILHRRLRAALQQVDLPSPELLPDEPRWTRLLQLLSERFEQWELHALKLQRGLEHREKDLERAYADVAAEHFKLEAVLGLFENGLAAVDAEGRIVFVSPSLESLLGWPESALIGRPLLELVEPGAEFGLWDAAHFRRPGCGFRNSRGDRLELDLDWHANYQGQVRLGALLTLRPPGIEKQAPARGGPLYGVRIALVSATSHELGVALETLGAVVAAAEPGEVLGRLLRADSAGVPFDLTLLDAEQHGLRQAIRREPALKRMPVLGVAPPTEELEGSAWSGQCPFPGPAQRLADALRDALAPSPETAVYPVQNGGPPALTVLLVEDEPISLMMMEECVRSLGHAFVSASDGEKAWELFQGQPFNVVISDWIMPGLTGPDLCRRVRQQPGPCYTYFIVLSGKQESAEVVGAIAACEADDYLVKPLNPSEIQRRLQLASRIMAQEARLLRPARIREGADLSV